MAHALMLTASSSGRAPVPTGDGSTLLVDEANAVMITVSPNPSSWDPEELTLLRGGQRVATPPMSDGTRWVLMGDDRFGTFQARATAAGTPVESTAVRVVPATVSLRATPAAAQPVTAPAAAAGAPPVSAGSGPVPSLATDSPATESQAASSVPSAPPAIGPLPETVRPDPGPSQEVAAPAAGPPPGVQLPAPGPPTDTAEDAAMAPASGQAQPRAAAPLPGSGRAPATTLGSASSPAPLADPAAPTQRPQGVVEVPLGEYDGRFAAVVAAIFTLLAVIVIAIVATQVISDIIIATPIPADTAAPDADSAARSARATSALLIGTGIILLLAAAALAALDVRGRQRLDGNASTALRGTQMTLDKAPGILENPGKLRGTLALLTTGVVVILIGFLGQLLWS
jgi:hypothetical protein